MDGLDASCGASMPAIWDERKLITRLVVRFLFTGVFAVEQKMTYKRLW
jgi:hypothetical protein